MVRAREWKDDKEMKRVPVEDSILTVVMTRGRGTLLLAIMHAISYQ